MELEKGKERYWICKQCYDVGKSKVLTAGSTGGISRHLNTHSIYAPCTTPSGGNTVDASLEGQHPLQAERWHAKELSVFRSYQYFERGSTNWLCVTATYRICVLSCNKPCSPYVGCAC
jgi:hypothetical protein